jgi:hypothetical protein
MAHGGSKIGEPITPERIGWEKWRAEHLPSPLEPPPGLSRLQRERMEKKFRKGSLRTGGLGL